MTMLPRITLLLLSAGVAACMPHGRRHEYGAFAKSQGVMLREPVPTEKELAADETSLATEARLEPMVRIALAKNLDLLEDEERVRERLDRVSPSGRLPDLELKYEQWGVPLARPYALGRADTLMLGVRQSFPAPGSLGARERAATADAAISLDTLRTRRLDVIRQVHLAFYDYFLAQRELEIHRQHVQLADQILDLTRSSFRTGTATEQDVLRFGVALKALHRDIARIEQRTRSAAALLNALMGRAAGAALGPPSELAPTAIHVGLAELERLEHRPEVLAAVHAVDRASAELDGARSEARWPRLMVGLDYMLMPDQEVTHGYGAMASINLPWFSARHREEVRAAERAASAERRGHEAVKIVIRYEVTDAYARYEAARTAYLLTRDELLPVARQSFESARGGFAAGRGQTLALFDALRTLLDIRLAEVQDLVALKTTIVSLKRAVGTDLDETPLATPGANP